MHSVATQPANNQEKEDQILKDTQKSLMIDMSLQAEDWDSISLQHAKKMLYSKIIF